MHPSPPNPFPLSTGARGEPASLSPVYRGEGLWKCRQQLMSLFFSWRFVAIVRLATKECEGCRNDLRRTPPSKEEKMAQATRPLIGLNVDFVPATKTTKPH